MRDIPNTTRSDSDGETSSEAGDIADAFTGKDYYQELINKANSVPLTKLFRVYGVRADANNRKTTCPFKSHKGGRESTPSFWYYPDTNTFYCFGCKAKLRPCDFVSEMDGITKVRAAHKVLELFSEDVDDNFIFDKPAFSEQLEIMLDFSDAVRDFYQTYPSDEARVYIEVACKKYDALNLKHKFDNDALRRTVERLKKYISLYKP